MEYEELTLNDRGESIIGYADYAAAMVDEIVKGGHIRERISVVRRHRWTRVNGEDF